MARVMPGACGHSQAWGFAVKLPQEFAARQRLADELHARPPVTVDTPGTVLSIATLRSGPEGDAAYLEHLRRLAPDQPAPAPESTHLGLSCGGLRIRWERHNEFHSLAIVADTGPPTLARAFDLDWLGALPASWLADVPGRLVAATQVSFLACPGEPPHAREVAPVFGSELLLGNRIADGTATMVTDLRSVGGVTRFLVFDHALNRRRAGRSAQRLVEIDTYRMMALMSLPLAQRRMGEMTSEEAQLASLMARFRAAVDGDDRLLGELTELAASVEQAMAHHGSRFSATRAYRDIVDRRLVELREVIVPGLQPLSEFLDRRFRPAMDSCAAASSRQAQLSERIARAAQLLQTRAEVDRERQNQALLASLDRRQALQVRLQETVEGLSVIAMTYYGVGLAGYLLKPLAKALDVNDAWFVLPAVPLIALLVLVNLRRLRRRIAQEVSAEEGGPR